MGLDVYLYHTNEDIDDYQMASYDADSIEIETEYEHLFKIGYFRSSYNASGINRVAEDMGFPSLYEIFDHDGDKYYFRPNWEASLKRAKEALDIYNEIMESPKGQYTVEAFHLFSETQVKCPSQALDIFMENMSKDTFEAFSNKDGTFFHEGIKLFGLIGGRDILGNLCMYGIIENHPDGIEFYRQALKIVIMTIEYVLEQDDPDHYFFGWSG
jgi:hypothetical protein